MSELRDPEPGTYQPEEQVDAKSRREFLVAAKNWSWAVAVGAVAAGLAVEAPDALAGGWVWGNGGRIWANGNGAAWINNWGGGGSVWGNGSGGVWGNGGGVWGNRGGVWGNGGGGAWGNRSGGGGGGAWGNGKHTWANRRGGGGWANHR